jgi:hypothetical protein
VQCQTQIHSFAGRNNDGTACVARTAAFGIEFVYHQSTVAWVRYSELHNVVTSGANATQIAGGVPNPQLSFLFAMA